MVTKRQCSFCAREIEPGTGTIYVKRDGTVFQFCSSSCRKQQLHLGRLGHRFKWTRAYELKRAAERSSAERAPAPSVVPRAPRPAASRVPAGSEPAAAVADESAAPAAASEPAAPKKPRTRSPTRGSGKPASKPSRATKAAKTAAGDAGDSA
jgi:large subunit ribosomal protein L24e